VCSKGKAWPPMSLNLSLCDLCMWGSLKERRFQTNRRTIPQLKEANEHGIFCQRKQIMFFATLQSDCDTVLINMEVTLNM
jgi:hypothetical protein